MYKDDQFQGSTLSIIVSISIVIINFILRMIIMTLIRKIGYYTESEQTLAIKSSIFVS